MEERENLGMYDKNGRCKICGSTRIGCRGDENYDKMQSGLIMALLLGVAIGAVGIITGYRGPVLLGAGFAFSGCLVVLYKYSKHRSDPSPSKIAYLSTTIANLEERLTTDPPYSGEHMPDGTYCLRERRQLGAITPSMNEMEARLGNIERLVAQRGVKNSSPNNTTMIDKLMKDISKTMQETDW